MTRGRILHLEDNASDAYLIEHWLAGGGLDCEILLADDAESFRSALTQGPFDLILADSSVPGMSPLEALHMARQAHPDASFVCLSGAANDSTVRAMLAAGAVDYVLKDHEWRLVAVAQRELRCAQQSRELRALTRQASSTVRLLQAAQDLGRARDRDTICRVALDAARSITGADGVALAVREHDQSRYIAEDAIAPLWKGRCFPMTTCISGWSMMHGDAAVIPDIYADDRVPIDLYRATFVRSLIMVPIRKGNALGAIGAYWKNRRNHEQIEVDLLQGLAEVTAAAMENVRAHQEQRGRLVACTRGLDACGHELDALSFAISHELRRPLQAILADAAQQGGRREIDIETCRNSLEKVHGASAEIGRKIDDLLRLAAITRAPLHPAQVDLSGLARRIVHGLKVREPGRTVDVHVQDDMTALGDAALLELLLSQLISNAWKFTSKTKNARIEIGSELQYDGTHVHFVRDNGPGFDMAHAGRLFAPFQHLHPTSEFPGQGIGLATVQRIVHRHGGEVWARARSGEGATFYFTLGDTAQPD